MELKDIQYEILLRNSREEKYDKTIMIFTTLTRDNFLSFDEAVKKRSEQFHEPAQSLYGGFKVKDVKNASFWRTIKIHAKEPIEPGVYVSPDFFQIREFSDMQYGEQVHTKKVPVDEVVFVNGLEEARYVGPVKHVFPVDVERESRDVFVVKQLDSELGRITLQGDIKEQAKELVSQYSWLDRKDTKCIVSKIEDLILDKGREITDLD